MGKDDVGPINELNVLLGRFAGEEAREAVMAGSEEVPDASAEEVAAWLRGVMDRLDALVDEGTRMQVMENLGFNCAEVNRSHIGRMVAKRNKFATLDEFLAAEERKPTRGTRLVREGDVVYQYYDPRSSFKVRCFCSLWRGLAPDEDASLTWCHCSRGFVMKLWEAYLGRPAEVELLESCISGAEACKFAIQLSE
jgi:predicted hydrocarbon binding protein